jgi:magnesium transporter
LTLEDVLQQDPREKLDHFERLGYYFLVVRALDEGYFKYTPGSSTTVVSGGVVRSPEHIGSSPNIKPSGGKEGRRRGWGMGRGSGKHASKDGEKVEIVEDNPGKEGLEGVGVGALNVYLVVFADGIVSVSWPCLIRE